MTSLKELEKIYAKTWPKKHRPLDMAYVNFIVHNFKKGKLLDVGCGFGELISVLNEFGFECSGIVATSFEAKECKRKGLDVIRRNAGRKFPFPSNSFDNVTCIGAIEHIENWQNALSEMHRVLKNNGKLLIETPNHSVFRKSKKYFEDGGVIDKVHFKEFEFDELKQELARKGFKNIKAHCKLFYYPNYFRFKFLEKLCPFKTLPYVFLSCRK